MGERKERLRAAAVKQRARSALCPAELVLRRRAGGPLAQIAAVDALNVTDVHNFHFSAATRIHSWKTELSTCPDVVYGNANPSFLYPVSSVCSALLILEFGCPEFLRFGFILAYSVSLLYYVGNSFVLLLANLPLSFKYSKETYGRRISSVPLKTAPSFLWILGSPLWGKPLCQLQPFLVR